MPYSIASAAYGERLATAEHLEFRQSSVPNFSTYLQLIRVKVESDTHTVNPFLQLHYGTQLYPFFIKVIGGLGLHVRVAGGEINSFIQNFKEPNIPLAYDYPEIILHATRFDDLTGNPTFPVFTMPNSYVYTTEALALGKNLVAERTTEETKITEPPILVSRQIVICRN
jgi:hypothetical protein